MFPGRTTPSPVAAALLFAAVAASTAQAAIEQAALEQSEATRPADAAVPVESGSFNAYFQATYIYQRHGAFSALYSGPNSLSPAYEKGYSFSGTAYLGWRLGPATELYFNPEVIQAVALSRLTGLGGLSNGENQKTAGPTPTLYRARLFIRHTWGFGGESEKIESGPNQLPAEVGKRRLVLTAGNLAVTDVFDANPYAHDPRTQFLNWSFMTHGAYDYAADARGYTWGAALEYYRDDWTLRAGRFLQPRESNGLQLDYSPFRHYGDQVELGHSHEIGGRKGGIRLLAYRNYTRMGGFRDALDFAARNGGVPDVANVRRDQAKRGYGIEFDQELASDVGFFARASWNDGATETYAFTEIERSVTGGVRFAGTRWGRAEDAFFLGSVWNGLGSAHRDYLAAGGLGFFIGDGRLNYRPERIVEAVYVAKLGKHAWVAPHAQRIANPAYNADRGPVTIAGLRLHFEF